MENDRLAVFDRQRQLRFQHRALLFRPLRLPPVVQPYLAERGGRRVGEELLQFRQLLRPVVLHVFGVQAVSAGELPRPGGAERPGRLPFGRGAGYLHELFHAGGQGAAYNGAAVLRESAVVEMAVGLYQHYFCSASFLASSAFQERKERMKGSSAPSMTASIWEVS